MIWFSETEADRVAKYAQREIDMLYEKLKQAEIWLVLVAVVTGLAAFTLGFGAGIWFVIYKLGGA